MKVLNVLKWFGIGLGSILVVSYGVAYLIAANISISTHGSIDLNIGNIRVPSERTLVWAERSDLMNSIILNSFDAPVEDLTFRSIDWMVPHLASGRNIDLVNRILQEAQPLGRVGSGHNYDFALCVLTLVLYSFGDDPDVLYPETVDHIVNELMTEKGGNPVIWSPKVHGLLPARDTENHILMTEGSRYLTNQWIAQHGNTAPKYDNAQNGLEEWLLNYLQGLERAGIHEYNSIPYAGYTLRGLLNIASFAEGPVGPIATGVLDRINWTYAIGSLSLRRYAPFRRHPGRAHETHLDCHYHTDVMKAWMSLAGMEGQTVQRTQHALWVGFTSYRPPDAVVDWVKSKPDEYFIQIGHGSDGSPELYSGGPGYLITAGGGVANDFLLHDCVARPTTLMLEDDAMDLKELLHVAGPGDAYRHWNNTGVHRRFAVSAGPVHIPDGWKAAITHDGWSFYERSGKRIAVYSSENLGIFCLLPEGDLNSQARQLAAANAETQRLKTEFRWPAGPVLMYDVCANKNKWVIVSVDGKRVDREHGAWPLMKGEVPGWQIEEEDNGYR